jgi:hypothetical protein
VLATDCVLVGLNEQSIGVNHQATADQFAIISAGVLIKPMSKKMPNEDNEITFEDCDPSTLFREFAAECMELAQTKSSPEKRALYLKMAGFWHQMAQRWEKKVQPSP